jgi:hypothetical protein
MTYTYEKITSDYGNESIKRTDDNGDISFIPIDPANSDYQAYLKWLENPNAEITTPTL